MERWERIKYIMDTEGFNMNSFSAAIGYDNNVTITRIIKEKRNPILATCKKITDKFTKYNLEWLFGGIEPMLNNNFDSRKQEEEKQKNGNKIFISSSDIKEGIFTDTLVYDIDATCGTDNRDIEFTEDKIIGSVDLPEISKAAKIVTANGDSMEPVIYNGNRVVIRQIFDWEDIFYGQIYLILLDEYRMIKYIRKYEQDEENYIILRSENPKYDDIKLHKNKIRKLFVIENILSVKTQI